MKLPQLNLQADSDPPRFMTQRDDAALKVSHDSSDSHERHSVTRPISSVREIDELSPEELASGADRGNRPTLMGLAPVEHDAEPDHASGSHPSHEQTSGEPETSTVRPAHWLASEDEQGQDAGREEDENEAEDDSAGDEALAAAEGAAEPAEEANEPASASASDESDTALPHAGSDIDAAPAPLPATDAEPRVREGLQVSPLMPSPEAAGVPEESESEWLDLSTRWLVTGGPRTEQPIDDENEVTDAYWAERLSARVAPRADTHSSAPPPPPQSPQLPGTRRATMAYGRPTAPETQPFDVTGQPRQWPPATRRHNTLAGISPLPEDPRDWPAHSAHSAHSTNDVARAGRPSHEPNPWREEPSYSDAPRPQGVNHARAHGPGTMGPMAANYAAPAGSIPPWAAPLSPYGLQPPMQYAPAAWNGGVALPPPWAATPNYVPHMPPSAYAPSDRRATRTMDYALPPNPASTNTSLRPVRAAQQHAANEISFEQWKGMANTWFMTVGKLALAAMALHFSGLAKPLLANFGYAPASNSAAEPAAQAAAPAGSSLAAASVIPQGMSPESAEEPAPRRQPAKRDSSATSAAATSEPAARRHSVRSAHKPKSKAAKPTRSAPAEAPATAAAAPTTATAPTSQAEPTPEPPVAAAPEPKESAGEAFIRINSRPWSEIFVDGTHVGHTPKLDLRVSPGHHRIRLVNQELGLSKNFEVNAAAGETVSHVELFVD